MTKTDYTKFAEMLADIRIDNELRDSFNRYTGNGMLDVVRHRMIKIFQDDNENFDEIRFLETTMK